MDINTNKLDIVIETGTDFIMTLTITDDDDKKVDLTGATVKSRLREFPESPDFYDFATAHNNTGGMITMRMSRATTARLPYSYGVYDILIKMADGKVYRPVYGDAYIRPGVTLDFNGKIYFLVGFDKRSDFPVTGNPDYLYIDHNTGKIYRWDGTQYVEITSLKLQEHPTFSVSVDNGHLYMHTEDDYRYPDFVLGDENGHLSVIYEN